MLIPCKNVKSVMSVCKCLKRQEIVHYTVITLNIFRGAYCNEMEGGGPKKTYRAFLPDSS